MSESNDTPADGNELRDRSDLPILITPDNEERKLGCLVPEVFPTRLKAGKDMFQVMTLDQIRTELAKSPGRLYFNRRQVFTGKKWIRNQRSHGSCNGFSTALALSRSRAIRGQTDGIILSGADAYSQMNGNRDNGSTLEDGFIVCTEKGISTEDLVPWDHIYSNQISAQAKQQRDRFKGFEAFAADTQEEFASGILYGYIGVVAVHATNSFNQMSGDGINQGQNGRGNHSTGVDDLKLHPDGRILFDMFNSWDTTWGDGGRTFLTWDGQLKTTVQYHRFWLLRAAKDDPQGDNPPPVSPR